MTKLDYVLNNIVPTHTSGTLFKWNFLDNNPNRDESCVDSYENYILMTWGKWYSLITF